MAAQLSVISPEPRLSIADQLRHLADALDRIGQGGGLENEPEGKIVMAAVVMKTDQEEIETVPMGHTDWLATIGLLTVAASVISA